MPNIDKLKISGILKSGFVIGGKWLREYLGAQYSKFLTKH